MRISKIIKSGKSEKKLRNNRYKSSMASSMFVFMHCAHSRDHCECSSSQKCLNSNINFRRNWRKFRIIRNWNLLTSGNYLGITLSLRNSYKSCCHICGIHPLAVTNNIFLHVLGVSLI
jgi:hypothetical protein